MKKPFRRREWLNKDATLPAWVITGVETSSGHINAELRISDCNRQIRLDFDVWDKKAANERLRKLHKLQTMLNDFEDAYRAALVEAGLRKNKW